eukprot:SAG11_NODE_914_length_6565_cov_8.318126_6_plen_114_part_00
MHADEGKFLSQESLNISHDAIPAHVLRPRDSIELATPQPFESLSTHKRTKGSAKYASMTDTVLTPIFGILAMLCCLLPIAALIFVIVHSVMTGDTSKRALNPGAYGYGGITNG